jgi:hypothetical protein
VCERILEWVVPSVVASVGSGDSATSALVPRDSACLALHGSLRALLSRASHGRPDTQGLAPQADNGPNGPVKKAACPRMEAGGENSSRDGHWTKAAGWVPM